MVTEVRTKFCLFVYLVFSWFKQYLLETKTYVKFTSNTYRIWQQDNYDLMLSHLLRQFLNYIYSIADNGDYI